MSQITPCTWNLCSYIATHKHTYIHTPLQHHICSTYPFLQSDYFCTEPLKPPACAAYAFFKLVSLLHYISIIIMSAAVAAASLPYHTGKACYHLPLRLHHQPSISTSSAISGFICKNRNHQVLTDSQSLPSLIIYSNNFRKKKLK